MPTHGNALAGGLAASLEAIEIAKLAAGETQDAAAGREVLFDARSHSLVTSRLVRNPACRFDHARWSIGRAGDASLREAFALGGAEASKAQLFVPDSAFASRLVCGSCRCEEEVWRLRESLGPCACRCPHCGSERPLRGFDLVDRIEAALLPADLRGRPLAERGLRAGEIFGVVVAGEDPRYFALDRDAPDPEAPPAARRGATVVVGGLGNIGSPLARLIAGTRSIESVLLCDPDVYEAHQLVGQDIDARAIGRSKAQVQAERLRAIRPGLRVEAFSAPVEHLPQGRLIGAIVVSCLDSRAARLRLAARAWRVGSPFVDAAVGGGSSLLVRTNVYMPEDGAACFECAFDSRDYATLEQIVPCAGGRVAMAPVEA